MYGRASAFTDFLIESTFFIEAVGSEDCAAVWIEATIFAIDVMQGFVCECKKHSTLDSNAFRGQSICHQTSGGSDAVPKPIKPCYVERSEPMLHRTSYGWVRPVRRRIWRNAKTPVSTILRPALHSYSSKTTNMVELKSLPAHEDQPYYSSGSLSSKGTMSKKGARTYERTRTILELEKQYAAGNYHPIGVVFDRALGAKVWDADGGEYIDCLSAYSAVNQ